MKRFILTLAMIVIFICPRATVAGTDRPKVPVSQAVAVPPRSLDKVPAQAAVGLKEFRVDPPQAITPASSLPSDSSGASALPMETSANPSRSGASTSALPAERAAAKAGIDQPVSADANVGLTKPLAAESVDEAGFMRIVLSCDDEAGLRDVLGQFGLTVREGGNTRALPEFLTGVDCDGLDVLKAELPASVVRAVRYVGEADASVAYVAGHPEQRFVIIVDVDHLSAAALKTLSGQNIVAIVAGHFHAFDSRPAEYAARAEDAKRVVRAIRLVSDAPVLLAVSSMNNFTRRTEKSWTGAFGDSLGEFDGWAVYNFNHFPAILESPTNPRTMILGRLALADRPCVLLDFLGGPVSGPDDQLPRLKAAWQAKGGAFVKALQAQGWRGVIAYASHPTDAQVKAAALSGQ